MPPPAELELWELDASELQAYAAAALTDGLPDPFAHLYGADGPLGLARDNEAVF